MLDIGNTFLSKISTCFANRACYFSLLLWAIFPAIMMLLIICNVDTYTLYGIVSTILYFAGSIGLIFGGIFLYNLFAKGIFKNEQFRKTLMLFLYFAILFLWCVFCTFFAKEKRMALYGFEMYKDNLLTYLFYGGFVLSSFTVGFCNKNVRPLLNLFSSVGLLASTILVLGFDGLETIPFTINSVASSESIAYVGIDYLYEFILMLVAIFAYCYIEENAKIRFCYLLIFAYSLLLVMLMKNKLVAIEILFLLLLSFVALIIYEKGIDRKVAKLFAMSLVFLLLMVVIVIIDKNTLADFMTCALSELKENMSNWISGLKHLENVGVIGYGPQNTIVNARNLLIQIALYVGVPGVFIFVAMLLHSFEMFYNTTSKSRVLNLSFITLNVFSIVSMLNGTIYYIFVYFFISLGFFVGARCKNAIDLV